MQPLIECIPNISEGRRQALVAHLASTAARAGAALLDRSSDADHHRTVLTLAAPVKVMVGAVEALAEAVFTNVDLRRHRGVHPRLGALDVVAFAPLAGAEMSDAVEAARLTAERLGERFELPVCLYGAALERPELAALRRGGPKAFAERLKTRELVPDAGPPRWDPRRGTTAVGARFYLVAFNVVLKSKNLDVARDIARAIRASAEDGLPAVRALGLPLNSRRCVQVSMNILDYRQTSLHAAFRRVRDEAAKLGVEVEGSEIVGLAPRAALTGGPLAELSLLHQAAPRVLESRLSALGLPAELVT
ncbi:MAG: glutamate formimidoyltransferase [Acidobacteriota bacterium]